MKQIQTNSLVIEKSSNYTHSGTPVSLLSWLVTRTLRENGQWIVSQQQKTINYKIKPVKTRWGSTGKT